jgi:hypothetical protein
LLLVILIWAAEYHLFPRNPDPLPEENSGPREGSSLSDLFRKANPDAVDNFFWAWLLFAAYATLRAWSELPDEPAALHRTLPHCDFPLWRFANGKQALEAWVEEMLRPQAYEPPQFDFRTAEWRPTQATRAQYIDRVLGEVRSELEKELDRYERICRRLGFEKATKATAEAHFEWLALYQVKEERFAEIARTSSDSPTTQTVHDGAKAAAELVIGPGWQRWLRATRRGRPRKR